MSSTRHAPDNSPLSQEKYMSSPEYAELRGLSGSAVARKAAYLAHPRKKSLLFWLQAMSLRPGGLAKLADAFLETCRDQIGTPTLWKHRIGDDECYPPAIAERVADEVNGYTYSTSMDLTREVKRSFHQTTRGEWLEKCVESVRRQIVPLFVEIAINPRVQIQLPGENHESTYTEREEFKALHQKLEDWDFWAASLNFFPNVVPAMLEFQEQCAANVQKEFVHTVISRQVFATLDRALKRPGRCALIEGAAGVGKSEAVKAWCEQHLGEARMISLVGVSHKTGFFRSIARVLGLASSYTRTATEMQARVEDVMQSSRLMLIIDEAQYGFSSGDRIYTQPEIMNWTYSALANFGVPVALVATESFGRKLRQAEQQVVWAGADAFKRRLRPHVKLPAKPLQSEMMAIARQRLPDASEPALKEIVGYAGATDYPITNLVDAIQDAREVAAEGGRQQVTYADARRAVTEWREPSDAASKQAFGPVARQRKAIETDMQPRLNATKQPVQSAETRSDFTGESPVDNPRFQPVNSGRTARDLATT